MRHVQAPHNAGDTLRDVLEYYRCYLSRNRDLADHCTQFLSGRAATQRPPKLKPSYSRGSGQRSWNRTYSRTQARAAPTSVALTLAATDSLSRRHHWIRRWYRSGLVCRQRLPAAGGGAFALITDKLKAKAQSKASQLAGHGLPTVLAITSDHAFASILLDRLAAEYLMTSAPQINVPLGRRPHYMSTDLRHSVFQRDTGVLDASGAPIIKPSLRSIGAILLIAYRSP